MVGVEGAVDSGTRHRNHSTGEHVSDTGLTVGWIAIESSSTDGVVLQTLGGIGGMLMAGVLIVVLGLVVVAAWRGEAASLFQGALGESGPAVRRSPESADEAPDGTQTPVEPQSETPTEPEPETAELTDEEVIIDILESNEGRMKQARIVDETGWSKSKVSMLLSEMEDDGDITKLRVGRENIISLSGNEPDAAGSPFDSQ
jgi:hypothetical protein